jgi:alpha-galactosidase
MRRRYIDKPVNLLSERQAVTHWIACVAVVVGYLSATATAAEQTFIARPPNGLALVLPMGWNSWNHFGCDISEATIRKTALLIT